MPNYYIYSNIYSNRIRIQLCQGKTVDTAQDLPEAEGNDFLGFILDGLNTLNSIPTGARLLHEIEATPHLCTIFAGTERDDNCAKPFPDSIQNGFARMVVNFRPLQKNVPETVRALKNPQRPMGKGPLPANEAAPMIQKYHDYKDDLKQHGLTFHLPTTKQEGWDEFVRVIRRADQLGGRAFVDNAFVRCGLTYDRIRQIYQSGKAFNDDTYYKLCFVFYEYLTCGPGCYTQVRIELPSIFQQKNKDLYKDLKTRLIGVDKKAWRKLTAILLGHELVHAWRMMAGRRVVDDGYDEEVMTVGFGPAAAWPLTENSIRHDLNVPQRDGYQPLPRYYAPMMQALMNNPKADLGF